MSVRSTSLLVAALLALPVSYAVAGGGGRAMMEQLGLSDSQRDTTQELLTAYELETIEAKAALKKSRLELKQLLLAETVDEKAAYKKLDEIERASAELHREKLGMMLELKRTLTPEQWERLVELRDGQRDERRDAVRDALDE